MGKVEYKKVLFVCTGNWYRSRLAEVLFNHYAAQHDTVWEAESRGLSENSRMKGLSPSALRYLASIGFEGAESFACEPRPIRVEDLESFNLIIGMNRKEHEPMMKTRYGQMAKILADNKKIRYWNVFDVPSMRSWSSRVFGSRHETGDQPEESSGEHIDFAVRSLVVELTYGSEAQHPEEQAVPHEA